MSSRPSAGRCAWLTFGLAAVLLLTVGEPLAAQPRELRLPGLEGGELRSGELEQGVVIVVVFATWSPRSRNIVERLNGIEKRWGRRARVVAVDFQEKAEAVRRFLDGKKLAVSVYLDADGVFSKRHAVTTLPSLLIFKDGHASYRGKLPDDPDVVLEQVLG